MTSFTLRNLSVIAYTNGYTHWHYRATTDLATITQPGYFADAAALLGEGDTMMVSCQEFAALCFVRDNTAIPMVAV